MIIVGLFLVILVVGGAIAFTAHVYEQAKATGAFQGTTPGVKGGGQRVRVTARRTGPAARTAVRQAPVRVRHIIAGAVAEDWVAKRAHIRTNGKPPKPEKPPRQPLLARLVFPGGGYTVAPAAVNGKSAPATPAAVPQPRPTPATAAPGRTSPAMTTATTSTSGGGAAGDLLSAVTQITAHARAGGMRSKGRAFAAFHEGFGQMAAGLEQFARDLQENSQYGPEVWEPPMQAAAHLRASAAQMGEGSSALSALARTPMGEVATSSVNAPRREEINSA